MFNKKFMILAIFFVSLLAVSAVSAADDIVGAKETSDEFVSACDGDINENQFIINNQNEDVLAVEDQNVDEIANTEKNELSISGGSFSELKNEISAADNYLKLNKNYIKDGNDDNNGISINKKITIDGNGFCIDGTGYSRGFKIYEDNVVLKNIVFKNFNTKNINDYGGAVNCQANNIILKDCTFVNCYSYEDHEYSYWSSEQPGNHVGGGAIHLEGDNSIISNCNFENCYSIISLNGGPSSDAFGGAINLIGDNSIIENCNFVKCYANAFSCYGGAISLKGTNNHLKNSKFVKCYSYSQDTGPVLSCGGAVYIGDKNNKVTNCNFEECYANSHSSRQYSSSISRGGAIFVDGAYCSLTNNIFSKCYLNSDGYNNKPYMQGAAIYINNVSCKISSSIFNNNVASQDSGIYCVESGCNVIDSILLTNTSNSVIYSTYQLTADYNWWGNTLDNFNTKPLTGSSVNINNWLYLDVTANKESLKVGESSLIKFNFDNLVRNGIVSKYYGINLPCVNFLIKTDYASGAGMTKSGVGEFSYVAKSIPNGFLTINYFDSKKTFYFAIEKGKTNIIAPTMNTAYNTGKKLVITLKDNYNHVIGNCNLKILFNGKNIILKTNNQGQVKLSSIGLKPNNYAVKISFGGNDNYWSSSATTKIIVKKATPKMTAKAKKFKKSVKTKKYSITLKTNQNKAMKNVKVSIKVNKKTYTAKTNNKGVATFKITKLVKKGTFKSTVTYNGDKYYNKVTKKVKIKIK